MDSDSLTILNLHHPGVVAVRMIHTNKINKYFLYCKPNANTNKHYNTTVHWLVCLCGMPEQIYMGNMKLLKINMQTKTKSIVIN